MACSLARSIGPVEYKLLYDDRFESRPEHVRLLRVCNGWKSTGAVRGKSALAGKVEMGDRACLASRISPWRRRLLCLPTGSHGASTWYGVASGSRRSRPSWPRKFDWAGGGVSAGCVTE